MKAFVGRQLLTRGFNILVCNKFSVGLYSIEYYVRLSLKYG